MSKCYQSLVVQMFFTVFSVFFAMLKIFSGAAHSYLVPGGALLRVNNTFNSLSFPVSSPLCYPLYLLICFPEANDLCIFIHFQL